MGLRHHLTPYAVSERSSTNFPFIFHEHQQNISKCISQMNDNGLFKCTLRKEEAVEHSFRTALIIRFDVECGPSNITAGKCLQK